MFRASGAHLQEDTVVHMQHIVLSLSMRVLGGLSVVSNAKGFKQIQKTNLSTLHMEPILTNFVSNF